MGRNFKFQVQDSDLEYFFFEIWRFEKRIALSEKKPPLEKLLFFPNFHILSKLFKTCFMIGNDEYDV